MTTTKTTRKPAPKSQSEKAAAKKSKALERAGSAIIDGKPEKAKKVLDAQKRRETKRPNAKQAVEVLSEAHTIEAQITALDHKIDGAKENLKGLNAQRETLLGRLRSEVRDMGQGRLPFSTGLGSEPKNGAKTAPKPAPGEKKEVVYATAPTGDQVDTERIDKAVPDELEARKLPA